MSGLKKGLQQSSAARMNAKVVVNSQAAQRKRSRSEIGDEATRASRTGLSKPRILFPERAKNGVKRRNKLQIDVLPLFSYDDLPAEVSDGAFEEMIRSECDYAPDPGYLTRQPHLNARMRAVLLDWMFEVGQEYGLKRDTLHFSINYVDRFLSRQENPVQRHELQLVGVTALWIASKMEEILPPPVADFAAATDGGCSVSQILQMEGRMLQSLDWDLIPCTAFAFANLYLQLLSALARRRYHRTMTQTFDDQKPWMISTLVPAVQLNRVMEVLDLAVLDIDSLCFPPSVLAATAVLSLVERAQSDIFSARDVEQVSNLSRAELEECIKWFTFTLALDPLPSNYTHRHHVVESTLKQELQIIQRHNPAAIGLFKEMNARRQTPRHEAAQRYLDRQRMRRDGIMGLDDSDEDPELRVYAQNKLVHRIVSITATERSFSPMTQISMSLAQTTFGGRSGGMGNHSPNSGQDEVSSPQRQIRFDGD